MAYSRCIEYRETHGSSMENPVIWYMENPRSMNFNEDSFFPIRKWGSEGLTLSNHVAVFEYYPGICLVGDFLFCTMVSHHLSPPVGRMVFTCSKHPTSKSKYLMLNFKNTTFFIGLVLVRDFQKNLPAATLPETNKSPLKMDGWNTTLLLGWPIFRCKMLVLGSVSPESFYKELVGIFTNSHQWKNPVLKTCYVSFREGNWTGSEFTLPTTLVTHDAICQVRSPSAGRLGNKFHVDQLNVEFLMDFFVDQPDPPKKKSEKQQEKCWPTLTFLVDFCQGVYIYNMFLLKKRKVTTRLEWFWFYMVWIILV